LFISAAVRPFIMLSTLQAQKRVASIPFSLRLLPISVLHCPTNFVRKSAFACSSAFPAAAEQRRRNDRHPNHVSHLISPNLPEPLMTLRRRASHEA
jgi:hypothetical protein